MPYRFSPAPIDALNVAKCAILNSGGSPYWTVALSPGAANSVKIVKTHPAALKKVLRRDPIEQ